MESILEKKHLLVVEDDKSLSDWMFDYLSDNDFLVTVANRGDVAVEMVQSEQPDLVVLDIMLPVKNGHQVCREIRAFYSGPVLILTANSEETDEIIGLELGADDFLSKPVRPGVLLARIRALLRRSNPGASLKKSNELEFMQFHLNNTSKKAIFNNEEIKITSNEFDLLWQLAQKQGQVVSRSDLIGELRGIDYDGFDRSVDLRISRLRKKLEKIPNLPVSIRTVWGKGYIFSAVGH